MSISIFLRKKILYRFPGEMQNDLTEALSRYGEIPLQLIKELSKARKKVGFSPHPVYSVVGLSGCSMKQHMKFPERIFEINGVPSPFFSDKQASKKRSRSPSHELVLQVMFKHISEQYAEQYASRYALSNED